MNESSNYPAGERPSISESVTAALRQPSFLRVMLLLAATVVVLVGIRLGAEILNSIIFAVVLALLFGPIFFGHHVGHLPGDEVAGEPHRRGWGRYRCCGRYRARRAYHGYMNPAPYSLKCVEGLFCAGGEIACQPPPTANT
jgi:hypothetical protein